MSDAAYGSIISGIFDDARQMDLTDRLNNKNRSFQDYMSSTSYQRAVIDLERAGLNPMLAYMKGGAPMGEGSSANFQPRPNSYATALQASLAQSNIQLLEAQAAKTRAEEDEVRARIPTHGTSIEKMRQEIGESAMRIERIIAETDRETASAAQLRQQSENLKAQIPQIHATVANLRALTAQHGAVTQETQQRIRANLPELEAQLRKLEAYARELEQPGREQDRDVRDGFIGTLGATLRLLNPFAGMLMGIGAPARQVEHTHRRRP